MNIITDTSERNKLQGKSKDMSLHSTNPCDGLDLEVRLVKKKNHKTNNKKPRNNNKTRTKPLKQIEGTTMLMATFYFLKNSTKKFFFRC